MTKNESNSKIYKGIDIYNNNGEEFSPINGERKNFIQNKMMKYFKKISDEIFFSSDNKGIVYYLEFNKNKKSFNITNLNYICNDSKYILVDIIKSAKFDFYFSLNLNPCLNIFKIKDNNNKKEIEIIQHNNLTKNQNNQNKVKYNKIFEIITKYNDCFILLGDNIIELWINNNNNKNINYEFVHFIKIENMNNENNINNDDLIDLNIISNVYKKDEENIVLLNLYKFQIIEAQITESKSEKDNNKIIPNIMIKNKKIIKALEGQIEKINSLFINKDYIFLGLVDSLVLISISYGEIIQKYQIGKVIQMKLCNDKKYVYTFVEKEGKFYFIKFKFIEYDGLKEEKRIEYKKWIYKFDVIENLNLIVIYNIRGLITLLSLE